MRIGDLEVGTPVLLAPMAAVTDLPFRTVCEEFGVGLTITEFLSAHALSVGDPKTTGKLTASLDGRRFGVQIFGREPHMMDKAAKMAVSIGASLVDINMGCPAKRVVAGECGSALMREPQIAQELVRTVVNAVPANIPVTVKHRAGWDQAHRNAPEFACAMVEAGAKMITVHGRTRTQGFSGKSDPDIIKLVREALPSHIPLVGNGDVIDVEGYQRLRDHTGCDAVMIGRGALGNPWLFARLREITAGRPDPGPPGLVERRDVFRRHVGLIETLKGGPRTLHEVRKACAWYARGLYGCNQLRLKVWEAPDLAAAHALVEDYFAQLIERESRLELSPEMAEGRAEIDAGFSSGASDTTEAADRMLRGNLKANDFLVANSKAMRAVVGQVESYADGEAPVLITGEHGTGRELVARVLHQRGPRTGARFVAVRPSFEDVPGKATTDDACERARRALRSAAGGTLLVKDVSDLSAPSQRTLRRAIRDRRSEREGAEVFDVHVVATGDLDVDRAVDAEIVSRDFYELFEPRRIEVPPLRDRLDDLPVLFERWIKHYSAEVGRTKPSVSTRAIQRLSDYPWPGNVAELKAIARRLVVRVTRARIEAGDVDEILPVVAARVPLEDLAFEEMVKAKLAGLLARIDGYPVHDLYEKVVQRVERPLFDLVLAHTGGNQLKAAEILGLNRNTLRKKLTDLGMQSKKRAGREDRALDGDE